jgi:cyclin B
VQNVSEYANDIINNLFRDEALFLPRQDYMESQSDITAKMRTILIDWLIEVHMKYRLRLETLHLAMNIIDRYLSRKSVLRKRLQLVGVVAMFMAAKFEEINPPEIHDWVYITDHAYTKEDVLIMECTILTALNFQIMVPTAAHFFELLARANSCDGVQRDLATYILDLGLLDIRMLQHAPSHMVSAALLLSNELLGRTPAWPATMVKHSRHAEATLRSCVEDLRRLLQAEHAAKGNSQLQAIRKKYTMPARHCVAEMTFF